MNGEAPPPRLNRFLARSGLGSRRSVEALITAGRVTVDGEVVREPGRRVLPGQRVAVDGREVRPPARARVLAFHKPPGVVSTLRAQDRRPCLADYRRRAGLPGNLVPVGRLDADSSGLLLWTDDGELAQSLTRPAGHVWKVYRVVLDGPLPPAAAERLTAGRLELDGRPCLPSRLRPGPDPRRWEMALREGRHRQVRRMFALVGRRVVRLHRVAVGPVRLGRLPAGSFRELSDREIAALRAAVRRDT